MFFSTTPSEAEGYTNKHSMEDDHCQKIVKVLKQLNSLDRIWVVASIEEIGKQYDNTHYTIEYYPSEVNPHQQFRQPLASLFI